MVEVGVRRKKDQCGGVEAYMEHNSKIRGSNLTNVN